MTWMTKDHQLRAEISAQFSLANRRNPFHSRISRPEDGPGVCQVTKRLPKEQLFIGCALLNVVKRAVTRHTARAKQPQSLGSSTLTTRLHTRFKLAQCRTTKVLCRTFLMPLRPHRGTIRCRKGRDGEILADRCAGRGTGRMPAASWRLRLHRRVRHRRNVGRYPRATHLWQHEGEDDGTDRQYATIPQAPLHTHPVEPGVSHPRTPVEYLRQDEWHEGTLPGARAEWHQSPGQGFTLHGHRLSSLYRKSDHNVFALTSGECPIVSSCRKYSLQTFGPGAAP